jgi:FKBP-type peptidyl-prolyl cis-trans isomerase
MKKLLYFLPLVVLVIACTPKVPQVTEVAPVKVELTNFVDSVSYMLGASNAKQIKTFLPKEEVIFNDTMFQLGFEEGYAENSRLTEEQEKALLQTFQEKMQAIAEAENAAKAASAKAIAATYLAENAKKEGVMTTASGLQYKVLTEGTGATPAASDKVEVHYEGRLIDGTVFDSSYKRGTTATFGVTQVISGWTEALQLMKEGDKFQLTIPSKLAYGERGSPPKIGPGETLIFDVELIKVIK